jgi:exodeoxyribonuclease V alpha subunit
MVEEFGRQFRVRDKVIQTANNYNEDMFNGDIGQIAKIDPVEREAIAMAVLMKVDGPCN